jgi:transposase-like protein
MYLKRQNVPIRKIARTLEIPKNTVIRVLRGKIKPSREGKAIPHPDVIRKAMNLEVRDIK